MSKIFVVPALLFCGCIVLWCLIQGYRSHEFDSQKLRVAVNVVRLPQRICGVEIPAGIASTSNLRNVAGWFEDSSPTSVTGSVFKTIHCRYNPEDRHTVGVMMKRSFDAGESEAQQEEVFAVAMKGVDSLIERQSLVSDERFNNEHGVRRVVKRCDGMLIIIDMRKETKLPFNDEKDHAAISLFVGVPNQ